MFHAYIQGRFTNQERTPDRLEIRRARLIFTGDPESDLSYSFQVDVAKAPYIMDAALTWKPYRSFRITAGQFKIPFSAESLISDNQNTPIARARAVNSLAPGRDTGVQGRDTGVQISGSLLGAREPLVDYALGIFRGQTLIYSPQAHYQAVAGRAIIHPVAGLSVGGDWYGSFDSTGASPRASTKRRSDAEGEYNRGPLKLRVEQIFARDGKLDRRATRSWAEMLQPRHAGTGDAVLLRGSRFPTASATAHPAPDSASARSRGLRRRCRAWAVEWIAR